MENMMTKYDQAILFLYFLIMILIPFYRKQKEAPYFNIEKKYSSVGLGFSIYASVVSSIAFVAIPGKSFAGDWTFTGYYLSIPVVIFFAYFFIIPYHYRNNDWLSYQHLARSQGVWASKYSSILFVLMNIGRIAVIFLLLNQVISSFWSIQAQWVSFVILMVILAQCVLGGFGTVVKTDIIQCLLMLLLSLVSIFLIFKLNDANFLDIFRKLSADSSLKVDWFSLKINKSSFALFFIFGFFDLMRLVATDQTFTQRIMASSNLQEARKAFLLGFILMTITLLTSVIIGGGILAYYGENIAALAISKDQVYPYFITHHFPPIVKGLAILGILSAVMSSIDSSLESSGNIISREFLSPLKLSILSSFSDRHIYGLSCALTSFFSMLFYVLISKESLAFDIWWTVTSLLGASLMSLFTIGFIGKKIKPVINQLIVVVGWIVILLVYALMPSGQNPLVLGLMLYLLTLFLVASINFFQKLNFLK